MKEITGVYTIEVTTIGFICPCDILRGVAGELKKFLLADDVVITKRQVFEKSDESEYKGAECDITDRMQCIECKHYNELDVINACTNCMLCKRSHKDLFEREVSENE